MEAFPENLDFSYAETLKKRLAAELSKQKSLILDCKNVERISLGCVQLLIATQKKLQAEDLEFKIKCSEHFMALLSDLGVQDHLHTEKEV